MTKNDEQDQNLPVRDQDFVLYCVDKMQSIPENLPEKIKNMMLDTIGQRMEMYLDKEEADSLSASNLLPKEYKDNSANIMLAFKTGRSLGLDRLQSLQHTFTVNGRTRVYGDMMQALAMKHRDYVDVKFEYGPDVIVDNTHGTLPEYVKCIVILKERDNVESIYTLENAKRNPNFNSSHSPWMNGHGRRMMKFRAQSFSLRDAFPDKLSGVYDEYEFEEIQTVNKDITAETTDLGKQSASENLKDKLKEDVVSETEETVKTETSEETEEQPPKEQQKTEEIDPELKPENIEQIKADFKKWAKEKVVSEEEYKLYKQRGTLGEWSKVLEMHHNFTKKAGVEKKKKPLGKFAKKLAKIVDDKEYVKSIESLIVDTGVGLIDSDNAGDILRTKEETLAKEVFNMIEDRKDIIDSAAKDAKKEEEKAY